MFPKLWSVLPFLASMALANPYVPPLPPNEFIEGTCAALSPDESQITICQGKKVTLRSLKTDEKPIEITSPDGGVVRAVYSPDGKYLALHEEYELSIHKRGAHVTLVRLADGFVRSYFKGWVDEEVPGTRVVFSPDSKWLAFLRNQRVFLKSLEDNIETTIDTLDVATSLVFSPDSKVIIVAGNSRLVYLSVADKRIVRAPLLNNRTDYSFRFRSIAMSRDGDRLAVLGEALNSYGIYKRAEVRVLRLSDLKFESSQHFMDESRAGEEIFFVMQDRGIIAKNHRRFFLFDFDSQNGELKPAYLPSSESRAQVLSLAPRSPFFIKVGQSRYNGPELSYHYLPRHWNPIRLEDHGVMDSNGSLVWVDDSNEYRFNFIQPIFEDAVQSLQAEGYRLANPKEVETALEALTKPIPWGEWHRPMQTFLENGHIWTDYPTGDMPNLKWVYSTPNTKINNLRSHSDWKWDWSMARFDHRVCSACGALGVKDRPLPP